MIELATADAATITTAVRDGKALARSVVVDVLVRIATLDPALGALTDVIAARPLAKADAIDSARARGLPYGPLTGVPFAVKNLFNLAGLTTRAGSR